MSSIERLCFSPKFSDKAKYRFDEEAKVHCIQGWIPSNQQTGRSFNKEVTRYNLHCKNTKCKFVKSFIIFFFAFLLFVYIDLIEPHLMTYCIHSLPILWFLYAIYHHLSISTPPDFIFLQKSDPQKTFGDQIVLNCMHVSAAISVTGSVVLSSFIFIVQVSVLILR